MSRRENRLAEGVKQRLGEPMIYAIEASNGRLRRRLSPA
jgi:hypothetical protein